MVVTSATIDAQKFSAFFDGAPVIEVPGTGYPIHTEVIRLGRGEHHTQAAARGACAALDSFLTGEPLVPSLEGTELVSVSKGTVLVLLPGKEDIRDVMRAVQWHAEHRGASDRVEVLECHGETEVAADDLIDQPLAEGKLRFVCATEVVRTSVTISEIVGVIDSLQVKRPIANETGVVHLDKITISRAESEQGKGRGGRERPAFYWPVSFERQYENLEPHPRPAVLYSPLESVALAVAAIGKSIRTFPMLDRPTPERIEVAITRLRRLGLMDGHEAITEFGREVERLSVDVASAASFYAAERLGVLPEAIVASAIRENEGVLWLPRRDDDLVADEWLLRLVLSHCRDRGYGRWEACRPEEAAGYDPANLPAEWVQADPKTGQWMLKCGHHSFPSVYPGESGARWVAGLGRKHWAGEERSDFAASVRAFRAYKATRSPVVGQFLNRRKVEIVEHTIGLLREDLASSAFRLNGGLYAEREFDGSALTKALATGLIDNVLLLDGRYRGPLGNDIEVSQSSACPKSMAVVLVGGVRKVEIPGRRGTVLRYFADMAAPVNPSWLAELMPQLCELARRGDHAYDRETDRVVETQEVKFVDLVLERKVRSEDPEGVAHAMGRAINQYLYREFQEVLNHNRNVQKEAQALFCRSGGRSRVIEEKDIVAHYATVFFLREIRSYAGWQGVVANGRANAAELLLSLEDFVPKAEQERILRENPDTITVLGEELPVQYADGYDRPQTPRVTLSKEAINSHAWLALPDEGVRLPGDRMVAIAAGYDSGTNIPQLKEQIKGSLNVGQWYGWTEKSEKPEIPVPDPAAEGSEVPFITAVYGQCVVTGEDLVAFGTVRYTPGSYYTRERWESIWYRSRDEAEATRAKAQAALEKIKADSQERRSREADKAQAEAAREVLRGLTSRDGWNDLEYEFRREVESRRYSYLPDSSEELRRWAAETKTLVVKVEAALKEVAERRGREAKAKERLAALLDSPQYAKCPVCSLELHDGHSCWDRTGRAQRLIRAVMRGGAEVLLQISRVGDEAVARLSVREYPNGEQLFSLWTSKEPLVQNPDAEIKTEIFQTFSMEKQKAETPMKASAQATPFEEAGMPRYFRHGCKASVRVTNAEWNRYLAGGSVELTCTGCPTKGTVQKK